MSKIQLQNLWLLLIGMLVVSGGCLGRKSVLQKYYLIELSASDSTAVNGQPPIAASCGISPVEVHPAFAGTRIAVRTQDHEINYYAHHKWALRPQESLTRYIEEFLQEAKIFAEATSRLWQRVPEYELLTEVNQLEVVIENDELVAHLNIEFRLRDNSSREVTITHASNRLKPLQKRDLNLFASAISEMLFEELHILSNKILSATEAN